MIKSGVAITVLASLVGLAGCATKSETIGTASGAALGAAVSNGGTIGTLGGAMVGYGLGRSYDQSHR
jgi:Glycine zipper 2TM domain